MNLAGRRVGAGSRWALAGRRIHWPPATGKAQPRSFAGTAVRSLAAAVWFLALALPAAHAAVQESALEFFSSGDFDGDGRDDLVIVDKTTGNYRLGYQLNPGTYTWVKARASGIENVSGFSAGRLFTTTRDALAFTAPDANRVNVFDAASPSSAGLPLSVFPSSLGPNLVIAIDIGGPGSTMHDDLFVGSAYNGAPTPSRVTLMRDNAAVFSALSDAPLGALAGEGRRVQFKTGGSQLAGIVFRGVTDTFSAYDLTTGALGLPLASANGLPAGTASLFGNFDGSAYRQFLFYAPGQSNLLVRPVQEPGGFTFGVGSSFPYPEALRQVIALPGSSNIKLLILFGGGARARVYNFNGVSTPTLVQEFTAVAGESFTGAGVLSGNNFILFSGRNGSLTSTYFQPYSFSGASYSAGTGGNLAALNALTAPANVFLFQQEPFVSPGANLLRSLNAGDWTSALIGLPPLVTVTVESFGGATTGLGTPAVTPLGAAHPLTQYGLVNQYREAISLFGYGPANGDEIADVLIDPEPGPYKKGIQVRIAASNPAHQIFYRLNVADPWTLYAAPFNLFKNTTVAFYARPPLGDARSRIKNAVYQFNDPPGALDSDGDGVPDYVEAGKGLDPTKSDTDGDGFSDYDELVAGTNPLVAASKPASTAERRATFDLAMTPRPYDGTVSNQTLSVTGAVLRAYNLQGDLLSIGPTASLGLGGVTDPAARLSNIVVETTARLLIVATEPHYDLVTTPGSDHKLGREMVGLAVMPVFSNALAVPYVYGGGDLLTEANSWIAAAQIAQATVTRPLLGGDFGIDDTLVALLLEKKLGEILASRGNTNGTNLTLFHFRPSDAGRFNPDNLLLQSLEFRTSNGLPGYLLSTMFRTLDARVKTPPNSAVADLRNVTAEIYRISSASNNAAPGVYPSPFDTLRQFLANGLLHSNYLSRTSLSGSRLASATTGAGSLLASVGVRPVTNIVLQIRSDSFTGDCTLLDTVGLVPSSKSLFHPGAVPYRLLESFNLVPGSQVQVFGYTDVAGSFCASGGIEVITLDLLSIPVASDSDADGDLLIDSWKRLFGVSSPFADDDGDGYSNLLEMLSGSDPKDARSHPATPPVSLAPPLIHVEIMPTADLKLRWTWPSAYGDRIHFGIRATPALGMPFIELPDTPTHVGDVYEVTLPSPGTGSSFYLVFMALR